MSKFEISNENKESTEAPHYLIIKVTACVTSAPSAVSTARSSERGPRLDPAL